MALKSMAQKAAKDNGVTLSQGVGILLVWGLDHLDLVQDAIWGAVLMAAFAAVTRTAQAVAVHKGWLPATIDEAAKTPPSASSGPTGGTS